MSASNTLLTVCKDIQTGLPNLWGAPTVRRERLPMLESLMMFSRPMLPVVSPGMGKVRKVESTWFPRLLESQMKETSTRTCKATRSPQEFTHDYEIDPKDLIQGDFFMEAEDLAEWCGNNGDLLSGEIARTINALDRKAATKIAEEVALMPGKWASDVQNVDAQNALKVPTVRNAAGDPAVDTVQKINFAAVQQTGYLGPYMVVGGHELYNYINAVQQGCCYEGGLNLGEIYQRWGMAAMYDRRLVTALVGTGADSLTIDMDTIQILNYVQAPWKEGMPMMTPRDIGGTGWAFVVNSPAGILYDVRISYDCGRLDVVIDSVVGARSLPDNLVQEGDVYRGVKWINKLLVDNS